MKSRLFFVSDIHGSSRLFLKFVNAAKVYDANVIIIGGDVAAKSIVPIFQEGGSYRATFRGSTISADSKEQLVRLEKDIDASGSYSLLTTKWEWDELTKNASKMNRVFDSLIGRSLESWCSIAEERLRKLGTNVIVNKGNDDPPVVEERLRKSKFVVYPNEKIVPVDTKHEMISLGYSNITPWNLPGDVSEDVLKDKIDAQVSKLSDRASSIFNIHVPPFNTHLDLAPKLNPDLTPKLTPGGEPEMAHVGSTSVRKAIEEYQPLTGLHGHIHESKGHSRIGRTQCFNPGSDYGIGLLKGVLLDISDGKITSSAFTEG